MSTKTTVALALAAGFIGGIASQRIMPVPVRAQEQASVPQEIRAHRFVLVDDAGVDRGVFGFSTRRISPNIELMDAKGHTWEARMVGDRSHIFLPDASCQPCVRKPAKKDSPPSPDGATPR